MVWTMTKLSALDIYEAARAAGFTPDQATTMTAIALAESRGESTAHNPSGEDSWGLWQINLDAHAAAFGGWDLTDPVQNARAAYAVSQQGGDISPWTVTHGGSDARYLQYQDEAQAAAVAYGDAPGLGVWSGVDGYGDRTPAGGGLGGDSDGPAAAGFDVERFLDLAVAQTGDSYVFGAEADPGDADPEVFDCSELVQWSAHQVGIELPDGSWIQYMELKEQGLLIPVEEAINTPGAILFSFSSEPTAGGGRPSSAHVAISMGDGTTIEARGTKYGVGSWEAEGRFQYAAVLPGATGAGTSVGLDEKDGEQPAGPDADGDGLSDFTEMSQGLDPWVGDMDADGLLDGLEVQSLSNPRLADTDGDGMSDAYELMRASSDPTKVDTDADGMSDSAEWAMGRDPNFGLPPDLAAGAKGGEPLPDADADGLSDAFESALGTRPDLVDTDGDGLADNVEYSLGTDGLLADTDGDGFADGFEIDLGEDALKPFELRPGRDSPLDDGDDASPVLTPGEAPDDDDPVAP
jgi:cell wall-associated NlpC family hydrolase